MVAPTLDQKQDDLDAVMRTDHGLRVLLTILQQCGHNVTTHVDVPVSAAFSEGKRAVAVELVRRMRKANFKRYLDMQVIEHNQEAQGGN